MQFYSIWTVLSWVVGTFSARKFAEFCWFYDKNQLELYMFAFLVLFCRATAELISSQFAWMAGNCSLSLPFISLLWWQKDFSGAVYNLPRNNAANNTILHTFARFYTVSYSIFSHFFAWGEWRLINVECNCHLHSTATRNALKAHYSLTIIVPYVIITTFMIRQINFSTKNK